MSPFCKIKLVPNPDGRTYRPFTSVDECMLRSFGGYDESDPTLWTMEEYREFSRQMNVRFLVPA